MRSPFVDYPIPGSAAHELNEMHDDEMKLKSPFLEAADFERAASDESETSDERLNDLTRYETHDDAHMQDEYDELEFMEGFDPDIELSFEEADGSDEEQLVYDAEQYEDEASTDQEEWEEDWLEASRTENGEFSETEYDLNYTQAETPVEEESEVSEMEFNNWFNAVARSKSRFPDEPEYNIDQLSLPTWVNATAVYEDFVQKYGGEANAIIGDAVQKVHARYFVIHDTAGTTDYTLNMVKGKWIHLWANSRLPVVQARDWHKEGLGVKLEKKLNRSFVHVEIVRDPALQKQVQQKTKGKKVSLDDLAKHGGIRNFGTYYNDRQYELVAYAYVVASLRRGKFLTVTMHREVDRSVVLKRKDGKLGYGHDDPQFFDIDYFYSIIRRILAIPGKATFGIQNERAMANKQSNLAGDVNAFIPYVTGSVEAANQYGPLKRIDPKATVNKLMRLKHGYYYDVTRLTNRFLEAEIDEELAFESSDLFQHQTGKVVVPVSAPPLVAEDSTVPGHSCYVRIDIGKGGYPLTTGIYIPAAFDPRQPADVIIYLHGMTTTFPGAYSQIMDYWSVADLPKYDLRIREDVNASGKNVVLVAPPLGDNPNKYPNHLSKKGGLDSYLEKVLAALNLYVVKKRFNADAVSFRHIVLAAHSAGGQHMVKIASADNPLYGPKIVECWGFDCIYYPVTKVWFNWAAKNANRKLFIYYQSSTEGNSKQLDTLARKLSNVFVKRSPAKNHYWVVKEHLKERIMKIGDSSVSKINFEAAYEPDHQHYYDAFEGFDKDWSNAARLNRQYSAQLGWSAYHDKINDLLLPFSGQQNVSLGEEAFAQALAAWQQQRGFSTKDSDGILGPKTWSRMQPLLMAAVGSPGTVGGVSGSNEQEEWESAAAIRAYYPTWQAYKSKRDEVVKWGVPDPANYIESALVDWKANPRIHAYFNGRFDGAGEHTEPHAWYLNLKRLYQQKGIANPAEYFTQNIVYVTFFNRGTPAHHALAAALRKAQSTLTAAGHQFTLTNAYSFVPRTLNRDINKLSNHALGRAIDINRQENPHIVLAEEILVINAACRAILPSGLLAESDVDVLRRASDHFKATFNESWISRQTNAALIKAIGKRKTELNKYARNGFMNLPGALVRALVAAGLRWGGAWTKSKDFMHFEM